MNDYNRREHDGVAAEIKAFVHDEFKEHEDKEKAWVHEMINQVLTAFPDGLDGLDGHHDFHAAKIAAAKAEQAYWELAKAELLKHGISALLTVGKGILILALVGFAFKLGFGETALKALTK